MPPDTDDPIALLADAEQHFAALQEIFYRLARERARPLSSSCMLRQSRRTTDRDASGAIFMARIIEARAVISAEDRNRKRCSR